MFVAVMGGYLKDKPDYCDLDLAYHLRLKHQFVDRPKHWLCRYATRRAGCDEARSAARSRSSSPPVPDSPRQSPPSPHHSSGAVAAFRSEPPPDENCGHQLANYLAHDPPASIEPGRITPSPSFSASWGSGFAYGISVWLAARRHGIAPNQLFTASEHRACSSEVRELQGLPEFGQ